MKRVPFFLVALGVFILDRITKILIEETLPLHQSVNLIPGCLDFYHTRNTGVAFGMLSGADSWWIPRLLTMVSATALIIILVFSFRHSTENRKLQWGLMLVLGGAVGNLFDRVQYGYVIDFIEAYFRGYHWPTFNAADACITVGIGLLMLEVLLPQPRAENGRALTPEDSRQNP